MVFIYFYISWNTFLSIEICFGSLQWRHSRRDGFQITSLTIVYLTAYSGSKLRVTGLCAGNSPVTGEFPVQMASNAEKISIWWRHRVEWCLSCSNINMFLDIRGVLVYKNIKNYPLANLCHHWFRQWLTAYLTTIYYLNRFRIIGN